MSGITRGQVVQFVRQSIALAPGAGEDGACGFCGEPGIGPWLFCPLCSGFVSWLKSRAPQPVPAVSAYDAYVLAFREQVEAAAVRLGHSRERAVATAREASEDTICLTCGRRAVSSECPSCYDYRCDEAEQGA